MTKLLVTGGAGFIGSNFIHYWIKKHPKDHIVIFDKLTYAGHLISLKDVLPVVDENIENPNEISYVERGNIKFVKGDITDPSFVDIWMKGIDTVVHFAAESHVDRSVIDPLLFVKTNVLGTANLLNAALEHKVKRFHLISTDEAFGELGPNDPPFNEHTPYRPRTPYSASKASSGHLARAYFETYGLPVTVSNCANNFGPFHDPEKLIPRFITNLLEGQKVPLMGRGENIRSWLYVTDHARAIDLILLKGKLGETYLIGGEEKTNLEVTRRLLEILGLETSMIEYVKHRLGHDFRYAIDDTKLRSLGWKPEHGFDKWLRETVNWYKENKWWWKPLKRGRPVVDRIAQKRYRK